MQTYSYTQGLDGSRLWFDWLTKSYVLSMIITDVVYSDVIISAIASQITSLTIVYSAVYSDQRKHQTSRHCFLYGELTSNRWIPRENGRQRGKCFQLITSSYRQSLLYWHRSDAPYVSLCLKSQETQIQQLFKAGHKKTSNLNITCPLRERGIHPWPIENYREVFAQYGT